MSGSNIDLTSTALRHTHTRNCVDLFVKANLLVAIGKVTGYTISNGLNRQENNVQEFRVINPPISTGERKKSTIKMVNESDTTSRAGHTALNPRKERREAE